MTKHTKFKESSVVVLQNDLAKFLRRNWRGINTKDYELLITLLICRIFQNGIGRAIHAGFPVATSTSVPANEYSYKSIEKVIRSNLEEKTPVDFFLVDEKDLSEAQYNSNKTRGKTRGLAFQVKRVAIKSQGDITSDIIGSLDKISSQYQPVEVALVLFVGEYISYNKWNFSSIYKHIYTVRSSFPFGPVFIIGISQDQVMFNQVWPLPSTAVYNRRSVLGDVGDRSIILKYVSICEMKIRGLLRIPPPMVSGWSISPDL